ncbi:DUF1045 domain-containing protein [Uliginosibacterium sp. H1]|uniref:DUF1045 domain-containing protein n=1 Tax=Uliginosibacterium sp. H1 TaxID=3114757 RepID=UPI002E19C036|nr:DUF1045 domain-containing protein [Uliginosibacterium sp. H1]
MADTVVPHRVAVYYVPSQQSAHWDFGCRWLGRDPVSGAALDAHRVADIDPARQGVIAQQARRYGLHATLKPPFRLREGRTLADVDAALHALATGMVPFDFTVELASLHRFLAWRPTTEDAAGQTAAVAAACVRELDGLRAPPDEAELQRRRGAGLSERQDALLQQWGYPYVMEEFRFHMTLTDALPTEELAAVQASLAVATRAFAEETLRFDALALFVEPSPGADFRYAARYGFDGSVTRFAGWSS